MNSRYHVAKNNYSFDALQAYCFGIIFKTVTPVISPGGDLLEQLKTVIKINSSPEMFL